MSEVYLSFSSPRESAACGVTQALRQSLLKKYNKVRHDLDELHDSRMSAYEKAECLESIRSEIQSAWRTDEIRRNKPSPQVNISASHRLLLFLE